jgi:exopolyphosphatase/guanosine-5'-triphosphate,3'-diphosphate pyrophosphatase
MNVASIDIGTNTTLLLIAEVNVQTKTLKTVLNEYRMPRIGKGLILGKSFNPDRINALYEVLDEYYSIIKQHDCKKVLSAATNAFRLASNKKDVISDIKRKWNIDIKIVSGDEEARLSYIGTIYQSSSLQNTVIDIGGGSTELIYGEKNKIKFIKSLQIGVVSLTEKFIENNPPSKNEIENIRKEIQNKLNDLIGKIPSGIHTIAVAGTPTSLAGIKLNLSNYVENKIDNYQLTKNDISEFISYFSNTTNLDLLKSHPIFLAGREDVILAGTIILDELMNFLKINELIVSTRGIRYGLVVDFLNKSL